MLPNKAVDAMTDHRIDMLMLSIIVTLPSLSSSASSVASSAPITTSSSSFSVTSCGRTAKTP